MGEVIRRRVLAAKVGVTTALLSVAGAVDSTLAQARSATGSWRPPASADLSPSGLSGSLIGLLHKAEIKIDNQLTTLTHKFSSYETISKAEHTFLKDATAGTEFLKTRAANADFLKIDDANTDFLKIDDANSEFLKVGATASNAAELGGLKPDAFVQGTGDVVSGYASVGAANGVGNPVALLASPDGAISVAVYELAAQGEIELLVTNSSGGDLTAVATADGTLSGPTTLNGSSGSRQTSIGVGSVNGGGGQATIQIIPASAAGEVMTLTVSFAGPVGQGSYSVVGQLLVGSAS
jgi:hypothetical protein